MVALSLSQTIAVSAFFPVSYVGSLYLFKTTRLVFSDTPGDVHPNGERAKQQHERWRNDPDVIKARLVVVAISSMTSVLVAIFILMLFGENMSTATKLLGMDYNALFCLKPHLLAPLLYLGPLSAQFLSSELPFQSRWSFKYNVLPLVNELKGIRNYIVAPITEEFVFRSCVISMMLLGKVSPSRIVFLSPLWFGIAHVHHAWEVYNLFGRNRAALMRAVMTCLFQLIYTTLFGWYTSFLFLRTGSILPPITAHMFCNIQGLPNPAAEFQDHSSGKIFIALAYIVGLAGFSYALWPWTENTVSGFW